MFSAKREASLSHEAAQLVVRASYTCLRPGGRRVIQQHQTVQRFFFFSISANDYQFLTVDYQIFFQLKLVKMIKTKEKSGNGASNVFYNS